jgi:hypothetical protein
MKKIFLLAVPVVIMIAALMFISMQPLLIVMSPVEIVDSDGKSSSDIIYNIASNGFDDVTLKLRPFGYVTVVTWEETAKFSKIKKATVSVFWKSDTGRGAGNIYVGYSTDNGASFVEKGPFNETDLMQNTTFEFGENFTSDIRNLQVRWRGEDLDYRLAAKGYVNFKMDVYA